MSNSANMTVADRLVQVMKDDKLGALVTDDDLIELAKKAIQSAMHDNSTMVRTTDSHGYRHDTLTSPVKLAAKEIAEQHCKRIVDTFMADKTIVDAVQKYMAEIMPGLVTEYLYRSLRDMVRQSYQKSAADLQGIIAQANLNVSYGYVGNAKHPHSDDDSCAIAVPHPEGGNGGGV